MKKLFKTIIFASLALFITTALSATKPITVILDWFINPDHAPLLVAQQQGYFKQQGINVTFIAPAQASDGPKLVAAGKADIAITYQPQFIIQLAKGLPLLWIGTLINHPLNCLVVLKSSKIKTINDLKGKRIAYTAGLSQVMLKTMLAQHGLNLNEVKLISVNENLTQALLSGQVDGATGMMRNFEPIEMQLAGKPARLFYPEDHGMPQYDELILVTNKNKKNNPAIKKFMLALKKGVQYLHHHPRVSWQQFAKRHPESNNLLNYKAWIATLPYFSTTPEHLNITRCQKLAIFLKKQGIIKRLPNLRAALLY